MSNIIIAFHLRGDQSKSEFSVHHSDDVKSSLEALYALYDVLGGLLSEVDLDDPRPMTMIAAEVRARLQISPIHPGID